MPEVQKKDICKSSNMSDRLQVKKPSKHKPYLLVLLMYSKKNPKRTKQKRSIITVSQNFSQFCLLNQAFCGFDKEFKILIQMVKIGIVKPNITLAFKKAPSTSEDQSVWIPLTIALLHKLSFSACERQIPLKKTESFLHTEHKLIPVLSSGLENSKINNIEVLLLHSLCFISFHRLIKIIESQKVLGWKGPLEVI